MDMDRRARAAECAAPSQVALGETWTTIGIVQNPATQRFFQHAPMFFQNKRALAIKKSAFTVSPAVPRTRGNGSRLPTPLFVRSIPPYLQSRFITSKTSRSAGRKARCSRTRTLARPLETAPPQSSGIELPDCISIELPDCISIELPDCISIELPDCETALLASRHSASESPAQARYVVEASKWP
jgi:hypothetical protein